MIGDWTQNRVTALGVAELEFDRPRHVKRLSDNDPKEIIGNANLEWTHHNSPPDDVLTIENPNAVLIGGDWYLFYSGNNWYANRYSTGVAHCGAALVGNRCTPMYEQRAYFSYSPDPNGEPRFRPGLPDQFHKRNLPGNKRGPGAFDAFQAPDGSWWVAWNYITDASPLDDVERRSRIARLARTGARCETFAPLGRSGAMMFPLCGRGKVEYGRFDDGGDPGVIGLSAKKAICVVIAGVLAGCTPAPSEEAPAPTTPPTTTSSLAAPVVTPLPPVPAPIVRPLDASRYATEDTVCDLLTDTQADELGLEGAGNPYNSSDGGLLTCNRNAFDTERDVEYNLWPASDVFAAQFGDRRRQGGDDAFLVDVAGQPAVVNGSDPQPACLVTVGLADRQGIEVLASDGDGLACALAVAVAERMVRNLSG